MPRFLALGLLLLLSHAAFAQTTVAQTTVVQAAPAQTASEKPLTLDEAVLVALRQHGDTGAAALSFEAARQGITAARAANSPEIGANLGYDFSNQRTVAGNSAFFSGSRTTSDFSTGVSVSQNLFDAGRTRQRINQAQARAIGAAGSYGNARNSLAYRVASAFFDQLRQEKLVVQREGQVALAQKQLEAINAQIEAGTVARVDAQTANVTLSQARFDLATSRNDLNAAQISFRNVLGLERGPALPLTESPLATETSKANANANHANAPEDILNAPLPNVPVLASIDEYRAEALNIRPDLLQTRANIQSNEAALKLAQIERKPQITASAGYDIDPRRTGDRGFTFGAGVAIPIFDAGGRKADEKAARASLDASKIQLVQLQKDVAADVETTFTDIGGEVERIRNARVLVEQARVNLDNATEKYRLGLGTILDITNAQTQLFNAQTSLTGAVYDYELARANLERAIGRFAWANPGQNAPQTAPATVGTAVSALAATQKPSVPANAASTHF